MKVFITCNYIFIFRYICFELVRYFYSIPFNSFYQLTGLDGNNAIMKPTISINGIPTENVRDVQRIYGRNEFTTKEQTYFEIFLKDVLSNFYMFQVFSIVIWLIAGYYIYVICVLIIGSAVITIALQHVKPPREEVRKSLIKEEMVTVVRDGYQYVISSPELIPGDVVVVNKSGTYLTFDGYVLTGEVVVDEGSFTGKTIPRTKVGCLADLDFTKKFPKLTESSKSAVFNGTQVLDTSGSDDEDVLAIVINTSSLTIKGSRISSAIKYRDYTYTFDKDCQTYLEALISIALFAFIAAMVILLALGMDFDVALLASLRLITVAIPPSMPFALTFASIFAVKRLEKRNIMSTNALRLTVAGKTKCVVFDKTGTLTKPSTDLLMVIESKMFEEQPVYRLVPIVVIEKCITLFRPFSFCIN